MLPVLPVLFMLPAQGQQQEEEEVKSLVRASCALCDAVLPLPMAPRDLLRVIAEKVHHRFAVQDVYNDIRKIHASAKYPHLPLFDEVLLEGAGSTEDMSLRMVRKRRQAGRHPHHHHHIIN